MAKVGTSALESRKLGYVLHSDHSIPNTVDYETYRYFVDRGLELGKTEA